MEQHKNTLATTPERRRFLRHRLARRDALLVPGAGNALTARIIQDAGFEAVYVTGAGIANTLLGAPDIGLVTLTELAATTGAISEICPLPLIVDIDTGFGNAVNTYRELWAYDPDLAELISEWLPRPRSEEGAE